MMLSLRSPTPTLVHKSISHYYLTLHFLVLQKFRFFFTVFAQEIGHCWLPVLQGPGVYIVSLSGLVIYTESHSLSFHVSPEVLLFDISYMTIYVIISTVNTQLI